MPVPQIEYGGALLPRPKFWTPRDLAYPTRGTRQTDFSRIWLKQDLMPWQRLVLDVAGEYNPDTGKPRRPLVVVTVQRQAGKSHMCFVKKAERAFSIPGYRGWYTAQTGQDARDQFLKFEEEHVAGTPLARFVKTLRGNGHEAMKFANKSSIRPHPPTEKSLHGKQIDDEDIDEGWAFSATEGNALMQAIAPTQVTRPRSQVWVWSAGGTIASTWLADLVARGRGGDPEIAYFEWGIPDPDDPHEVDLDDYQSMAEWHPAYGHTVDADALRKLRTLLPDDAEYARAAGNRWTEIIGGAINATKYRAARLDAPIPDGAPIGYGAARAVDGSEVALVAAARVGDEIVVEVLDVMPVYGAADTIKQWVGTAMVAVPPTGPNGPLYDACKLAKVKLAPMKGTDASAGVGTVLDMLDGGGLRFRPHVALDAAVKVAGTRRVGDGGKAWALVQAGASIAALDAATSAVWALQHRAPSVARPTIRTSAA